MLNVVLLGAPGAGKGTQSKVLVRKYNLFHISTGDVLRAEIIEETELGLRAEEYIHRGELVPDKLVIDMMRKLIEKHSEVNGFVFDGFPRTTAQAEELGRMLEEKNTNISILLRLNVERDEVVKRMRRRASKSERSDDKDISVVLNRLTVYERQTKPVAEYYKEKHKCVDIDGKGAINEIHHRLCLAIDNFSL